MGSVAYLLHQLLVTRAHDCPDRNVISSGSLCCTYRELNELSNRVAHVLREAGVGRGDRVALLLDKSIDAVAAIFGIMKAGAVYVPLDTNAPFRRLSYILDDCRVRVVIADSAKASALFNSPTPPAYVERLIAAGAGQPSGPIKAAVTFWSELSAAPSTEPPDPHLIEDDLAYILYTSGSTGVPKGVMISHRASLTFVIWSYETLRLRPSDRLSSHAPFHFDLSIFDIFASIMAGATIVPVPPSLNLFPRGLAKFIASERISVWYSAPSALSRLATHGQLEEFDFSALRAVLFAGEVFPVKHLRELIARVPHATYYNLYGPTETNVCTWYEVTASDRDRTAPLPIGKSCANFEVFILNEQKEIVRDGEIGELCVRGPGLMKGYWGLPEKTREVLHPFQLHPDLGEQTIYCTGDLTRLDREQNFLFLGRRDNMIKSRGYRIELNEIEATLNAHPEVDEAAAVAVPDAEIGSRIEAFVVASASALKPGTLEAFCAERIPKYMIPARIHFRGALPRTSTGKADRVLLAGLAQATQEYDGTSY